MNTIPCDEFEVTSVHVNLYNDDLVEIRESNTERAWIIQKTDTQKKFQNSINLAKSRLLVLLTKIV